MDLTNYGSVYFGPLAAATSAKLINPIPSDGVSSQMTSLTFCGVSSAQSPTSPGTLASLTVAHSGTSTDNRSTVVLTCNNGSGVIPAMTWTDAGIETSLLFIADGGINATTTLILSVGGVPAITATPGSILFNTTPAFTNLILSAAPTAYINAINAGNASSLELQLGGTNFLVLGSDGSLTLPSSTPLINAGGALVIQVSSVTALTLSGSSLSVPSNAVLSVASSLSVTGGNSTSKLAVYNNSSGLVFGVNTSAGLIMTNLGNGTGSLIALVSSTGALAVSATLPAGTVLNNIIFSGTVTLPTQPDGVLISTSNLLSSTTTLPSNLTAPSMSLTTPTMTGLSTFTGNASGSQLVLAAFKNLNIAANSAAALTFTGGNGTTNISGSLVYNPTLDLTNSNGAFMTSSTWLLSTGLTGTPNTLTLQNSLVAANTGVSMTWTGYNASSAAASAVTSWNGSVLSTALPSGNTSSVVIKATGTSTGVITALNITNAYTGASAGAALSFTGTNASSATTTASITWNGTNLTLTPNSGQVIVGSGTSALVPATTSIGLGTLSLPWSTFYTTSITDAGSAVTITTPLTTSGTSSGAAVNVQTLTNTSTTTASTVSQTWSAAVSAGGSLTSSTLTYGLSTTLTGVVGFTFNGVVTHQGAASGSNVNVGNIINTSTTAGSTVSQTWWAAPSSSGAPVASVITLSNGSTNKGWTFGGAITSVLSASGASNPLTISNSSTTTGGSVTMSWSCATAGGGSTASGVITYTNAAATLGWTFGNPITAAVSASGTAANVETLQNSSGTGGSTVTQTWKAGTASSGVVSYGSTGWTFNQPVIAAMAASGANINVATLTNTSASTSATVSQTWTAANLSGTLVSDTITYGYNTNSSTQGWTFSNTCTWTGSASGSALVLHTLRNSATAIGSSVMQKWIAYDPVVTTLLTGNLSFGYTAGGFLGWTMTLSSATELATGLYLGDSTSGRISLLSFQAGNNFSTIQLSGALVTWFLPGSGISLLGGPITLDTSQSTTLGSLTITSLLYGTPGAHTTPITNGVPATPGAHWPIFFDQVNGVSTTIGNSNIYGVRIFLGSVALAGAASSVYIIPMTTSISGITTTGCVSVGFVGSISGGNPVITEQGSAPYVYLMTSAVVGVGQPGGGFIDICWGAASGTLNVMTISSSTSWYDGTSLVRAQTTSGYYHDVPANVNAITGVTLYVSASSSTFSSLTSGYITTFRA